MFVNKSGLKLHIRTIHQGQKFKCEECSKLFRQKANLERHVLSVHKGIKHFSDCEAEYAQKWALKHHIKKVHEALKPFECSTCKKRFFAIAKMKKHISEVHEKIKNFQCPKCDKKFGRNYLMKDHVAVVHDKIKNKECPKCDKKFGSKQHLKEHVRLKNSQKNEFKKKAKVESKRAIPESENKFFSCELCPYSNDRKWNLQRHVSRYHEGEIPFKCQHCDKKFKSEVRCNDHETAVHQPDFEGFKCPQCPKIFAYSTCLKRHIKMFHQE